MVQFAAPIPRYHNPVVDLERLANSSSPPPLSNSSTPSPPSSPGPQTPPPQFRQGSQQFLAKRGYSNSSFGSVPQSLMPGGGMFMQGSRPTSAQSNFYYGQSSPMKPSYDSFGGYHLPRMDTPYPHKPVAQAYPQPPRQFSPLHAALWGGSHSAVASPAPSFPNPFEHHQPMWFFPPERRVASPESFHHQPATTVARPASAPPRETAPARLSPAQLGLPQRLTPAGTLENAAGERVGMVSFKIDAQHVIDYMQKNPKARDPEKLLAHLQGDEHTGLEYHNSKFSGSYRMGNSDAESFNHAPDMSRMPIVRDALADWMAEIGNKIENHGKPEVPARPASAAGRLETRPLPRPSPAQLDLPNQLQPAGSLENAAGENIGSVSFNIKTQDVIDFLRVNPYTTDSEKLLAHLQGEEHSGLEYHNSKFSGSYRTGNSDSQSFNHAPDMSRMPHVRDALESWMRDIRDKLLDFADSTGYDAHPEPAPQPSQTGRRASTSNLNRPQVPAQPAFEAPRMERRHSAPAVPTQGSAFASTQQVAPSAPPTPPKRTGIPNFTSERTFPGRWVDDSGSSRGTLDVTIQDKHIAEFLSRNPNSTNARELLKQLDNNRNLHIENRPAGTNESSYEMSNLPPLDDIEALEGYVEGRMKLIQQAIDNPESIGAKSEQAEPEKRKSTSRRFFAKFGFDV